MIFDKGDNKVSIPYYLYRWVIENKAGFYLCSPYDPTNGSAIEIDASTDELYLALPGAYKEWFESV